MSTRDHDFDSMERAQLEQIQLERLQATLNRAYRSVSYYRQKFDELDILLENIDSLESLRQLPFTTHETLLASYPYRMFAVPLREVVRLHCSSGPAGEPLVLGYTRNDIEHWTQTSARVLQAAGVHRDDVVQICLDYGLYGAGLGFHYGAEHLGASAIPASDADVLRQLLIMRDYRTTILLSTPDFALKLIATLLEQNAHSLGSGSRSFTHAASDEMDIQIEALLAMQPEDPTYCVELQRLLKEVDGQATTVVMAYVQAAMQVQPWLHNCKKSHLSGVYTLPEMWKGTRG